MRDYCAGDFLEKAFMMHVGLLGPIATLIVVGFIVNCRPKMKAF